METANEYEKRWWKDGKTYVIGMDEAGRGPLAGPLVVAAVCSAKDYHHEGIYDSKKGRIFYPMASIRFPHCDEKKLGSFNFDSETQQLLVYAGDGNTYLLKAESLTPMVATLKDAGYTLKKDLYVPL